MAALILLCVTYTCKKLIERSHFTHMPGFAEYFEANPPGDELPDGHDRELLYRLRPRFMVSSGHQSAVDFYKDYISKGILRDGNGKVVSSSVTQDLLNRHKDNYEAVFTHLPGGNSEHEAVVYGRIKRETVTFDTSDGLITLPFTFLVYNIVFSSSGPPTGIPPWQETALSLFFDLDDWHQLDHFTAVTLALEGDRSEYRDPTAVMLQQHDNVRTYLVEDGIKLPDDGRVVIDVAIRSNELYPHSSGPKRHRAVRIPDAEGLYYLISGKNKPLLSGHDITDSIKEIQYTLAFLPPDDAFYTFKGFLGEKRMLPGRNGPPGAYYNTIPELMPMNMELFSGFWRENHSGDLQRLRDTVIEKNDFRGFARLQGREFYKKWNELHLSLSH
jgi:hypothetical protein